jgi:hypothetical protein
MKLHKKQRGRVIKKTLDKFDTMNGVHIPAAFEVTCNESSLISLTTFSARHFCRVLTLAIQLVQLSIKLPTILATSFSFFAFVAIILYL